MQISSTSDRGYKFFTRSSRSFESSYCLLHVNIKPISRIAWKSSCCSWCTAIAIVGVCSCFCNSCSVVKSVCSCTVIAIEGFCSCFCSSCFRSSSASTGIRGCTAIEIAGFLSYFHSSCFCMCTIASIVIVIAGNLPTARFRFSGSYSSCLQLQASILQLWAIFAVVLSNMQLQG